MARYIKANVKVAEYLKLTQDRCQVKDGNYLLWQNDMLAFGRLTELPQIMGRIGGLLLQAHEAREEQDGTVSRKLPAATDPQFVIEEVQEQQPGQEALPGTEEAESPEPVEEATGTDKDADPEADTTTGGAVGEEETTNDNSETETEAGNEHSEYKQND